MTEPKPIEAGTDPNSVSYSVQRLTRLLYWYPVVAMILLGYVLSEYLGYDSFGRALMFQPNDMPGAPFEIRNTIVTPLLGQHFAGDLFLPYLNVREGVLEAYYGVSLLTLNLLKELEYWSIFLLFLLLSVGSVKWSVRFLCQNNDLRGPSVTAFLVTLPFLTSLDRGNLHGLIIVVLLAVLATFLAPSGGGGYSSGVNLRSKWYDPLIFGAILSIKVYMVGVLLICFASTRKSPTHQKFLLASAASFLFFLLSPSLFFGENLLYWTLGGPNASVYRSEEYFLGTRRYNTSILAILVDRDWVRFSDTPMLSVIAIAGLSLFLAFAIATQRGAISTRVPHAFLVAVSVALLLPISGGYTTAIFGLPWLVACNEYYVRESGFEARRKRWWRRFDVSVVNPYLLLLSSLLLVPIFTVTPGSPLPLTVRFVMPCVVITAAVLTAWIAVQLFFRFGKGSSQSDLMA